MINYFHNGLDIKVGTLPLFLAILAIWENRHLIDSTPFPKFPLVIARTFVTLKTEGNKINLPQLLAAEFIEHTVGSVPAGNVFY